MNLGYPDPLDRIVLLSRTECLGIIGYVFEVSTCFLSRNQQHQTSEETKLPRVHCWTTEGMHVVAVQCLPGLAKVGFLRLGFSDFFLKTKYEKSKI